MSKWSDVKIYDLSIPIGILTPPWPTYEPMQMKFFKRLAPNGANGQLVTHSNHVGTHLDGPLHFDTAGRDIASLELTKLCAPGVVVDLSDMAQDFGIYTPKDITDRADVHKGDILIINTGYHKYCVTPARRWTSSSGSATWKSSGSASTAVPPTIR